jgi:hypothetical protein
MSLADRAPRGPRILTIDLERVPGRLPERDIWEPRDLKYVNYIHPSTWLELPSTACFAYSWNGGKVEFAAAWQGDDLAALSWKLFHEATGVLTFNGKKADERWLKQDWAARRLGTPSPWKSIDLYVTARREFALESKSLDFLCQHLGIEGKRGKYSIAETRAALAGDVKMQRKVARYNRQDVQATWQAAVELGPFVKEWPHVGVHSGQERCCWRCGSQDLRQDGFTATAVTLYALLQCECGAWSRTNHRKHNVTTRAAR